MAGTGVIPHVAEHYGAPVVKTVAKVIDAFGGQIAVIPKDNVA